MNFLQVKKMMRFIFVLFALKISCSFVVADILQYSVDNHLLDINNDPLDFKTYEHERQRRQVSTTNTPSSNAIAASANGAVQNVPPTLPMNLTDTNKTFDKDKPATVPILHTSDAKGPANATNTPPKVSDPILANDAAVDEHRLLGVNGSGIWYMKGKNGTADNTESALSNNDINNIFKETPETIKAEQNIANLTYDDHSFYKSSFIGNVSYFQEYWTNISKSKSEPHEILSNSHRRASTVKLSFDFPFYGHGVRNITVATGGFLYTGDLVHNWLAATQYISPLMANFDTTISNDSLVKMSDDGEKFTVFWENATLQEAPTKKFTFAVTLYKNGDIVFAYKDIPIAVQSIQDDEHPVKVGISDAYLKDKILFYVRRKTIYEYHRVSFKNHEISNNTILRLTALPTCLQYNTCSSCVNHDTGFNCTWCEQIQKCSSGTDRNKQDWLLRNCDKFPISNETACPAVPHVDAPSDVNTAYATDNQSHRATVVHTLDVDEVKKSEAPLAASVASHEQYSSSPVGGVVTAFIVISLICCLGGWLFYAFKNPLSRSGQILIRYRPSQWGWRRGEARYTAATIHM